MRLEQLRQVLSKVVPLEVSIKGKLVSWLQSRQVTEKLVTPVVTPEAALNSVMLVAPYQAPVRLVPKSMSVVWISVIRSSSPLELKFGRYTTADEIFIM